MSNHDWYLPIFAAAIPVIFVAGITYCLWTGTIPARGVLIRRDKSPGTFWFVLGFFAICGAGWTAEGLYPNWGIHLLEAIGILRPMS